MKNLLTHILSRLPERSVGAPASPLIITGPTASGKTGLAMALAEHMDAEIISADSALIYQGMDIGTAKPSTEEQSRVPHHLIDILSPEQSYSAAQFVQDTEKLIRTIQARGKLPLIVGGTMLYLKALREGLDDLPSADLQVRARIQAQATEVGWPAMHAQLQTIDPKTAARLAPMDAQRISRALEVHAQTGKALSAFFSSSKSNLTHSAHSTNTTNTAHASDTTQASTGPVSAMTMISLEPRADNRAWLHARIAQRFEAMLQSGLVDEVQRVYQQCQTALAAHPSSEGPGARDLPSMRCVGYRQVIDSLEGRHPWETLFDRGVAATRQLAKRQLTWLRGMNRVVLHPDSDA